MDTTVEVTTEVQGMPLRTRIRVTQEELEKFNQILKENPEMDEINAIKQAKGINQ